MSFIAAMLSIYALTASSAVEVPATGLHRSMRPYRGVTSIGALSAERLGVRSILQYLFDAEGNLIFMGEVRPPEGTTELIIGRADLATGRLTVLRRSSGLGVVDTVSVHIAAFHYPTAVAVNTRLVVIETRGHQGRGQDEETRTTVEILGASGEEAGRILGSAEIGMVDVQPSSTAPWRWVRASEPPAGEDASKDYRGRRVEWRITLGRVARKEEPDLLVWQRHFVAAPAESAEGMTLEREVWGALVSRPTGGYQWVTDIGPVPEPATMLWSTLDLGEAR